MAVVEKIKKGLVDFFYSISKESVNVIRSTEYTLTHIIILSRFCVELSKGVLEAVMSMYNERLFKSLDEDAELTNTLNYVFKTSSQVPYINFNVRNLWFALFKRNYQY